VIGHRDRGLDIKYKFSGLKYENSCLFRIAIIVQNNRQRILSRILLPIASR
jgi:hypothetical protein